MSDGPRGRLNLVFFYVGVVSACKDTAVPPQDATSALVTQPHVSAMTSITPTAHQR